MRDDGHAARDGRDGPRTWTRAGLALGARLAVPAMPVMALFSAAFGVFAGQKGLTLAEAVVMSGLMFAGASQFVAAEVWVHPMTTAAIATLCLVTATINLRFLLVSASLRPWLGGLPAWQVYPALAVLTEPGWIMAVRYRAEGGSDSAILLGSGVALWLIWIAGTLSGYLLGSLVEDPRRYGFDVVMPVFFAVILVPLWRGPRVAIPWLAGGAVALVVARALPGAWYMVAGALAGAVTAGLQHERP